MYAYRETVTVDITDYESCSEDETTSRIDDTEARKASEWEKQMKGLVEAVENWPSHLHHNRPKQHSPRLDKPIEAQPSPHGTDAAVRSANAVAVTFQTQSEAEGNTEETKLNGNKKRGHGQTSQGDKTLETGNGGEPIGDREDDGWVLVENHSEMPRILYQEGTRDGEQSREGAWVYHEDYFVFETHRA